MVKYLAGGPHERQQRRCGVGIQVRIPLGQGAQFIVAGQIAQDDHCLGTKPLAGDGNDQA
jgi:hypothetical protein